MSENATYLEAANQTLGASNGVTYAYRSIGPNAAPLVALQHFRGNLDNWDPALIDALAVGVEAHDHHLVDGLADVATMAPQNLRVDAKGRAFVGVSEWAMA